jgi:bifunctional UDP-N-acetylglucosamine pyrophosphorylase/glucosamine-1-phosphate N-acetyltransferase
VLEAAAGLRAARTVVVACHGKDRVASYLERWPGVEWVDQGEPLGTGHAVLAAGRELSSFRGDVLVLFGDNPLLRGETLSTFLAEHRRRAPVCTTASARLADPTGYGRIVRGQEGALLRVVEEKDADEAARRIREVHCGLALFRAGHLFPALQALRPDNAQGEYYLTDVYRRFREAGGRVDVWPLPDDEEGLGFNTPEELLACRKRMRLRILARHQAAGVLIEDPDSVHVDHEVEIGAGTRILPFVVLRAGVKIGRDCEVGPFSHLRRGTVLEDGAEVGNFVEVKNSRLGPQVKAKHLSYLGDAVVGRAANIGAGTITANFDGRAKHETRIGEGAFIGSGTVLIAPVSVGDRAVTGAGAVVTRGRDVAPGTTVLGVPARPLAAKSPRPSKAAKARTQARRRSGGARRKPSKEGKR